MHTKTDGPAWLRRRHGRKAGSAGVPPAQRWHSLTPLSHPARPATGPRLCFGRARAVPAGGAAGCPIAGKLSGSQRHSMRAGRPRSRWGASSHPSCSATRHCPCRCGRAVPLPVPSKTNHECTRMHTKTDGPAWLRRRHGMKAGSAGVPPAQHWHSLTPLPHPARPAAAPRLCFGRARAVPAGGAAGCPIAGKLSGSQRHSMRAGRPRSRRGASSHPSCSARRHCPCRCGGAVPLSVPSKTNHECTRRPMDLLGCDDVTG